MSVNSFKRNSLALVLIIVYSIFMISRFTPYLSADEGTHALTSLFYTRLVSNLFLHGVPSLYGLYNYITSLYVHYPKFSFFMALFSR